MAIRILSFDTSTSVVHLALLDGAAVVTQCEAGNQSADRKDIGCTLMPEVDAAVRRAGWNKQEIDLVVVGVGPGSFTGIRVGVITARTLAQALGLGLIGVSTLEAYYVGSAASEPAATILSSTSGQYFYGGFQRRTDDPCATACPPGCGPSGLLMEVLASIPLRLADDKFLHAEPSFGAQPLPVIKNMAVVQAQLALDRVSLLEATGRLNASRGKMAETFPWQNVLPLYLRSPSVTVKKTHAN